MSKCIIVLGMHRSGTSAFTGVLNMLGMHLGSNLLESKEENPKGFFENKKIFDINNRILKSLGTDWDDFFPLDENWWMNDSLDIYRNEIKNVFENEFMGYEFIGIKDPRICILASLWTSVISELNIKLHFILALRNPMEVAFSLKQRNGFSTEKSLLLWINHMLSAEYHSRGFPRAFCLFDNLISDPGKAVTDISKCLNISFPISYEDAETSVAQFIDPILKHHKCRVPETNDPVSELVYDYYKLLEQAVRTNELNSERLSKSDSIRKKFFDTCVYFDSKDSKELVKRIQALENQIQTKNRFLEKELEKESEKRDKDLEFVKSQISNFEIRLKKQEQEYLRNLSNEVSRLEREKAENHQNYQNIIRQFDKDKEEIREGYEAAIRQLEEEKSEIHRGYEAEIARKDEELIKIIQANKSETERLLSDMKNQKKEFDDFQLDALCFRQEAHYFRQEALHLRNEYDKLYQDKSELERNFSQEISHVKQKKAEAENIAGSCALELDEIKNSLTWKFVTSYRRNIERWLPWHTRRRRLYHLGVLAPVVLLKEGPKSFFRKIFIRLPFIRKAGNVVGSEQSAVASQQLAVGSEQLAVGSQQSAVGSEQVLTFPQFDKVRVSIIIPVCNKSEYTLRCLQSVLSHTQTPYEVIVTDNASVDDTPEMLASMKGIRVIHNQENQGFVTACNQGAEVVQGDYCLFLNNDTEVTDTWLEAMLRPFEDEKVGIVGAKLIYPDGRLQEAGNIIWKDGTGWNYGRDDHPDLPQYSYPREVDYCSGACLMIRKDIWLELGGFDKRYAPAYYEDTDLCFAARHHGYKVMYQPEARVIHHEGVSAGTDINSGYKKYQQINHALFREKWQDTLESKHFSGYEELYLARERGYSGTALVVDHYVPTFDMDSGSLRMFSLLKIMKDLGYKVVFWPENRAFHDRYTTELQRMGIETMYGDINFEQYLKDNGTCIDLIFLSRPNVAVNFIYAAKKLTNARIIYDTVDLHFLREERRARVEAENASKEWKQTELLLAKQSDETLVVSSVEKEILEKQGITGKVSVLSNVHSLVPFRNSFDQRAGLMFIGGFLHLPNEDGITWFAESVLPLIRQNLPHVHLYIVGSNPTHKVKSLAAKDITVTGYVEDVSPYFEKMRVFVSPLRYGAGVKGKIGQSMSFGLPVVTTSVGAEGMGLKDNYNALIADDKEKFAEKVVEVYQNQNLWEKLSLNCRELIEQKFSHKAARESLSVIIEKLQILG